jgi:hypothetical protein
MRTNCPPNPARSRRHLPGYSDDERAPREGLHTPPLAAFALGAGSGLRISHLRSRNPT